MSLLDALLGEWLTILINFIIVTPLSLTYAHYMEKRR